MSIKIEIEKVLRGDGEKCVKVLSIDALGMIDLPEEYTGNGEMVFKQCPASAQYPMYGISVPDRYRLTYFCDVDTIIQSVLLEETKIYTAQDFYTRIIPTIKRCGKRLRQINRQERDKWRGKEEIVV